MIETILFLLFLALSIYYLIFLLSILTGLTKLRSNFSSLKSRPLVSIIIPFRNEAENILENLRSIEAQDYESDLLEVVYVNDDSEDESEKVLRSSIKKNNIKVISVPENFSPKAHKKKSIRFGIDNSSGEIIVTTDADCVHNSNWISKMVSCFSEHTGFVSGPVVFNKSKSLFKKLQRVEFAGLVLTGAGLIGINKPTICNGANLAYRRSVFNEVDGFKDQFNLSSGDDELLMQKIFKLKKYDIKFCYDRDAIVYTEANSDLKNFYNQRKRWASKGLFYSDKLLILKLILIFLFYLSFPVQFILAFTVYSKLLLTFALSFLLKIIFEYLIIKKGAKELLGEDIKEQFFLAQLLHIPYILITSVSGLFGDFNWKGRQLKR
ncbi:MAG: glycosyltransferase [Ignavibacteriaceae bacterium]|nr:glycosyltransferase [Ignavibacteriaceae bacterium]